MIPSAFVFLPSLPLTANGKVDRKAVPKPEVSRGEIHPNPELLNTEVQEKLCQIWRAVFKRQSIGIHDSFFMLGGHSLLAVKLIHEINHEFNIRLPFATIFEQPTIAGLSDVLQHHKTST